jgi:hypothetical protein
MREIVFTIQTCSQTGGLVARWDDPKGGTTGELNAVVGRWILTSPSLPARRLSGSLPARHRGKVVISAAVQALSPF